MISRWSQHLNDGGELFTGLISEVGSVRNLSRSDIARLTIEAVDTADGIIIGDSVAVNGVCLTITAVEGNLLTFDVVNETLRRTNLNDVRRGDLVNLERPIKAGDEFGGHFVLGHVDGIGRIRSLERGPREAELEIAAEGDIMKYIVEKGSIAVDGISLTVAAVREGTFTIAVIPHTMEATNLIAARVGNKVNLETDIIGKYVERFLRKDAESEIEGGGITEDRLRELGY